MTKAEMIERYGIEWYEQYTEQDKVRKKERYHNDPEFRESELARFKTRRQEPEFMKSEKARNRAWNMARYVRDGRIDLIENYELTLADDFKGWHIHHRLELHPDCTVRFTKQSLIKLDLYYNRPPSELIWLKSSEHKRMHKGKVKK